MKTSVVIGIVLIAIGILSLAYQGITYTTREKVVDLDPIEATQETRNRIPLPPVMGGIALAGGVVLILAGRK